MQYMNHKAHEIPFKVDLDKVDCVMNHYMRELL